MSAIGIADEPPPRALPRHRWALVPTSVADEHERPRIGIDELPVPLVARAWAHRPEQYRLAVKHAVGEGNGALLVDAAERWGVGSDEFGRLVLGLAPVAYCTNCNEPYIAVSGRVRHCSDRCRREWFKRRMALRTKLEVPA